MLVNCRHLAGVLLLSLSLTSCDKADAPVKVTGVTLSETKLIMHEGDTETITVSVSPDNADDTSVSWVTGNPLVATVDNGVVHAVGLGATTVIARTNDGGITASCKIIVAITFEDANFKAYCVNNFDKDRDGEISVEEAEKVSSIELLGEEYNGVISSLKGIQGFAHLKLLEIDATKVKDLDLSSQTELKSLTCLLDRELESINISKCSSLETLYLSNCAIKDLDMSMNPKITEFCLSGNEVKKLPDFRGHENIEKLSLVDMGLSSFDASAFTNLKELYLYNNSLSSLNLSGQEHLSMAWCQNNNITDICLDGCKELVWLYCSDNNLTKLDLSPCSLNMHRLDCNNNPKLTEIWLKDGQTVSLWFYDPNISTIKYKD